MNFPVQNDERKAAALYDAELVRRFKKGELCVIDEIIEKYHCYLFAVAKRILNDNSDVEEIVQDVFIRAYQGLDDFRGECSLLTWLSTITINLARNRYWYWFRRHRADSISIDSIFGDDGTATIADLIGSVDHCPTHEAAINEFSELVETCSRRLPWRHREILAMRNVQNLSYEEIATRLCMSVGTVKSRIARARQRLREVISELCPDLSSDGEIVKSLLSDSGQRSSRIRPL